MRWYEKLEYLFVLLIFSYVLTFSDVRATEIADRARPFTGDIAFDGVSWTIDAAWLKIQQIAIAMPYYIQREKRKQIVDEYLHVTNDIIQTESAIRQIYADPGVTDPDQTSAELRSKLETLNARQDQLAPLAESIIQEQLSSVLGDIGLTNGGQPTPPVLYHVTPLPMALIISPRNFIQQDASLLLLPDVPIDQQEKLENEVTAALDVSTMVTPVGGLGAYPTMVIRITDLRTLIDIVSHEWTHNFLIFRPLGINYDAGTELHTMNETTASIVGGELSQLVMEKFYPERLGRTNYPETVINYRGGPLGPNGFKRPVFDYRAEMHKTRIRVDELLTQGLINEAEQYMEARRQIFWQNGYAIRKLNQAYFAFYGAYADSPGGAAGEDPVGPAVRALRGQSATLTDFLERISWMKSFAELQAAVGQSAPQP